ncbi:GyrI-like domain-containing protein [Planococcus sp. N028]|uniref:GyrI-like domain-containing protein n=1 Tax=Planococcus shixiaomingii TaxID=3058393 RepID=A0ABT8N141_9BACL|nr:MULTISPECIES: GyrI-like domain-containing protein [unclassified Planococcus (in: firmicutes)]MDN7241593.1 GyrI-like domain-containing protein [Planococcus sp. N028]WKA53839.1 GyrI-like domain-containing protein [Planococcus sp. N022]
MTVRYINEPTIEIRSEQPYVGIAVQATLLEWDKMKEHVEELYEWLAKKEIEPAGPLFFRYWIIGSAEEEFHVEVGIPVERMAFGDEQVIVGVIPGGTYLSALHQGHPDHLAKSFNELEIWAKKEGLELDRRWEGEEEIWNGRFECYLTDPQIEPDPAKWEIQLSYLLMSDDAA